jgi:hypothetical protein
LRNVRAVDGTGRTPTDDIILDVVLRYKGDCMRIVVLISVLLLSGCASFMHADRATRNGQEKPQADPAVQHAASPKPVPVEVQPPVPAVPSDPKKLKHNVEED